MRQGKMVAVFLLLTGITLLTTCQFQFNKSAGNNVSLQVLVPKGVSSPAILRRSVGITRMKTCFSQTVRSLAVPTPARPNRAAVNTLDPRGENPKVRPFVIVTKTDEIAPEVPFVGVAITGTFSKPPLPDEVQLPWRSDGHPRDQTEQGSGRQMLLGPGDPA